MKNYARSLLLVCNPLRVFRRSSLSLLSLLLILCPFISSAQKSEDTKISVSFNNITLKQAFSEIENKSKIKFIFNEEAVSPYRVTLKSKDESVKQVLINLLKNTKLDFQFKENKCIILDKKSVSSVKMGSTVTPPGQVPMATVSIRKIHGKIIASDNNLPLPNATLVIKEFEAISTQSDSKGEFSINFPANAKTIVITHIGFLTKEVQISASNEYTIVLEVVQQDLNDVVVIGPFTRKAESFTGSAATFSQEQLRSVGNQNIIQSLKVLDPSFIQIENNLAGSDPNTLPDIQIRGANSLPGLKGDYSGNPNVPLFILDGFETNLQKIYDLDMNRVASVTILKDASAKAIYGSRAANGVVVVETKRPEAGKLRVSYTADINLTLPDLSSYSLTNAAEKLQVELDAGRYKSVYYYSDQLLAEQYNRTNTDIARGVDTYWLSQPVRTGIGQKHTLSIEGGDPYLRYGADFTYNNIQGAMKGSDRKTTSGNIFLSYRFKNLMFKNTLTVGFNRSDDSPYGNFSAYTRLNPYWAPYDDNGQLKKVLGQFSTGFGTPISYYNPLYNASIGTKNFSKYTDITNNFQAEWSLSQAFKIIGKFGYTNQQNSREDFYPASHTRYIEYAEADFFKRGDYTITDGNDISIKSEVTLNYSRQLGKHLFFLNAGWNLYETSNQTHGTRAQGFLNDRVDNINFALQYAENSRPLGSDAKTRETGLLSALNYSYDDRFLADLSFRKQGSSVFGANNRWGNFWSVGIGWNLHKESFLEKLEWLNQLKLRTSTGYTGSQNFNPYQAMATYNYYTDTYYDNIVGAKLMALANNELKWQQTQDYNFGVDLRALERLSLRFDYYISNTNNLLTDLPLPGSTGFSTIKENLGEVQNKGIDATVSYKVLSNPKNGSFLSLFFSAGTNKNKLVKISNALKSINDEREAARAGAGNTAPFIRYKEGESTTAIYVVPSLGIDPTTGNEIFLKANGEKTYVWNANDQVSVGDATPKIRGSFGFNSQYKGWGLNCAFSYRLGGKYYNQTLVDRIENADIEYNVDSRVFTGTWKQPGDVTYFKRISVKPNKTYPTSRFVQEMNELLMSSLNTSYDFKDAAFLKKSGLQRLRVTLFTNDIFRIASVKTERGLDFPYARSLSFSVQATF
ncbi:MAG: SusC/RagA family TonB-linked outer membrane protein [Candidatus Pedobacter colombiensis]|uniref:SusC/RagA family TonB-linked outer membrane protein n=1 Tax=Candidatus Pedobacter colombiensis TaxID=3121371 RepID=A0AAJ5W3Z6_9SPHI|nr:SusC/RagA family TonB-linked outer membrane protein [Pedobacter sp.]WEK17527.1 MAG: SusC/RagA family TonB-linked outer membrane protein [Pedobacter sp.]